MDCDSDQSRKGFRQPASAKEKATDALALPAGRPRRGALIAGDRAIGSPQLVTGNAGDHVPVHTLLRAVQQAPSHEGFANWLDEPSYEPSDRLLVKTGGQIVAHLQLLHRGAWFHGVQVPVGSIQDLAALPEYLQRGYDHLLLTAAEQMMRDDEAIVSLVSTDQTEVFRACGWMCVQAQGYSRASVGDILAHLSAQRETRRRRRRGRKLHIRLWRHVELDAVRSVYRAAAADAWGAWHRTEHYWRWLTGRNAHSELIVAVEGPDDWEDLATTPKIVGYAVTHGPQVVEMCCLPEYSRAAPGLLARACQDAIERDHHTLSLHTSPADPLHELIVTAGGSWCCDAQGGGKQMIKLLDPQRWVAAIHPVLERRTKRAHIDRPTELLFDVAGQHYRLLLTRRSSRLTPVRPSRADVSCDACVFAAVLVGNVNVRRAHDAGRLSVSDPALLRRLAALFPAELCWFSHFDVLCD